MIKSSWYRNFLIIFLGSFKLFITFSNFESDTNNFIFCNKEKVLKALLSVILQQYHVQQIHFTNSCKYLIQKKFLLLLSSENEHPTSIYMRYILLQSTSIKLNKYLLFALLVTMFARKQQVESDEF